MTVTVGPSSALLGPVPLGASDIAQLVVVNPADGAVVSVRVTGEGFTLLSGGGDVAPGESREVYVEYEASQEGEHPGAVEVVDSTAAVVASASLSGTTTASLRVGTSSLAFGSVLVGSSGVMTLSVTNATGGALTLSPAAPFSVEPSSVPSAEVPQQLVVRFDPTAATAYSVSLSIGSETVALTGTGIEESDAAALDAAASAQATADVARRLHDGVGDGADSSLEACNVVREAGLAARALAVVPFGGAAHHLAVVATAGVGVTWRAHGGHQTIARAVRRGVR